MKQVLITLLVAAIATTAFAQDIIYFDKKGKLSNATEGYYKRQKEADDNYKSTFINGDGIAFEGKISVASTTDENQNKYVGKCKWYYKNGKLKTEKNYNEQGIEEGTSNYYYESGKLWKEIEYLKGVIKDNRYTEYGEDGKKSKIFEETFANNSNDWDLYASDKSSAKLNNGMFELTSLTKEGTSRYINLANSGEDMALEATFNFSKLNDGQKAGFVFGFKDWNNYNYYLISKDGIYVGTVYEGISATKVDGMYVSSFEKEKDNSLKIITFDDKIIFSVNGEVSYSCETMVMSGTKSGFAISGKGAITVDNLIYKEINYKNGAVPTSKSDADIKATGSGILIAESGYIITNHHVIEDAKKIQVEMNVNGVAKTFTATLIQQDKENDLAIIKINDDEFKPLPKLKYSFKESGAIEVGASVFTIGFPLALSGMGKEVKFTDGKTSAKTGYNGALNSFQTSIPVQPGNSGGPVFTDNGEMLGVINSTIKSADNVSYAIKLNYIKNLVETISEISTLPNDKSLLTLSTEEKIKILTNYVTLIKVK